MKTLKLEVGKTYRSREGQEVKIVEKNREGKYLYKGSNDEWYAENGRFSYSTETPYDLIEEIPTKATRHTFAIPDGVKEITVEQVGNRIVVEMVPEEAEPKPGDVMINEYSGVYILKEVKSDDTHTYFVMLGKNGHLFSWSSCFSGRPATPEEAQPLWDALKKAGKRWNAETLEVEEIPEYTRIREWLRKFYAEEGEVYYTLEDLARMIGSLFNIQGGKK